MTEIINNIEIIDNLVNNIEIIETIKQEKVSSLDLTELELEILINLADKITASPSEDAELYCQQAKENSTYVPERIRKTLLFFKEHGSDTGILVVKRIPVDDSLIGITPPGNNYKTGEKTNLAKIQALLDFVIGEMIAYEAEGYGRIYQDIVPSKSDAKNQTSLGSIELEIHTEQAFSQLKPDILTLGCLRGDPEAKTHILPVKYILEHMTLEEQTLLKESLWITGVDLSFKLNGCEFLDGDIRGPMAIIHGQNVETDPLLLFDQDLMHGINEQSESIVKRIVEIYYQYRLSHTLSSGEIVFIDNHRCVHGRSGYSPRYDGKDRFLIRSFVVFDYQRTEYGRTDGGRVVEAIYS